MAELITLARPYAKAAFEYAVEQNALAPWCEFLHAAASITLDSRVAACLLDPRVSKQQLFDLYCDVLAEGLRESMQNFLHLLLDNNRLQALPDIISLFEVLRADYEKTVDVDVRSFLPLEPEQEQRLAQALKERLQRDVSLHIEVDKNLLGGTVIRAKDLVIDGSARSKLARMAEQMTR